MKFTASIEINTSQLRTIIEDYLERNGIKNVSDQDIHFIIEEVERGDQRDPWKALELTKVKIDNIRVGND